VTRRNLLQNDAPIFAKNRTQPEFAISTAKPGSIALYDSLVGQNVPVPVDGCPLER
jgi:hypothetical protein